MGALRALILAFSACAAVAWISPANADELVMPYVCAVTRGAPHLTAASPTTYQILGAREDMPFSACASSPNGACETMMVHKFTIDCGGQKVSWAKVAASGGAVGVHLPSRLPAEFAPISRFQGRFVLPGFGRTTRLPKVETQALSADSVIETSAIEQHAEEPSWVTVIDPTIKASTSGGGAFKVAGVISTLLISLMAACLFVARRRMPLNYDFVRSSFYSQASTDGSRQAGKRFYSGMGGTFRNSYRSWFETPGIRAGDDPLARSLDAVHARIVETELLIATLPQDLLLRDVLQTELDTLRGRAADVARRADQLDGKRAGTMVRALLRDLDRITRIVNGTVRTEEDAARGSSDVPSTVFEASRVLGLNPEAPPAAVKKVVDALRVSWHPDHARSEVDRRHREERIKQINAAWDILKAAQTAST